jgi:hypothetical protein
MLADRNQRKAAEDTMSWPNVYDWLRACVVHLFRALDSPGRERHESPRRHQGGTLQQCGKSCQACGWRAQELCTPVTCAKAWSPLR